jgi:hypothetical protein
LVLLSLDRVEFLATTSAAESGDEDACEIIRHMWDDHLAAGEINCFLCDSPVELPIFALICPEYMDNSKLLACPLCLACRGLPSQRRYGRALKILKKMAAARTGRPVHFVFNRNVKGVWRG